MRYLTALFVFFILFSIILKSAPGDTTRVNVFGFEDRRQGWVEFPDDDTEYQKIIINYKVKCPEGKPCGEWDYIANVQVRHWYAPSYTVNGNAPETYSFMLDTSYSFTPVQDTVTEEWSIVKTAKEPVIIRFYGGGPTPTNMTDSLIAWPVYYDNYVMDENGNMTDSTFVEPDSTINLTKTRVYYNDDVTKSEVFEIMRYITPYGNGLDMGSGWNHKLEVTDFLELLRGEVYIDAPCGGWGDQYSQTSQESLELTFDFIEGTPPRDLIHWQKMWEFGGITYDGKFEELVDGIDYNFSEEEKGAKLRIIQTGHGFGGNSDNCAEFCRKESYVKVDGEQHYTRDIWRECGDNPLHPQGGTWLADRTNWCPGAEVQFHDYELSAYITPGETSEIDYDMEFYDTPWAQGSNQRPYWKISSYMFTYGAPNLNLDASLSEIIAPNTTNFFLKSNPICGSPIIVVENRGGETLTSLKISYGVADGEMAEYSWEGELKFMESDTIELPITDLTPVNENKFVVELSEPNGGNDENTTNDKGFSYYENVPGYPGKLEINLRTTNYDLVGGQSPYQYFILDAQGNVVHSLENTENSKEYIDNISLEKGCYTLILQNIYGYGLFYWALRTNDGTTVGAADFTMKNGLKTLFRPEKKDFGNYIMHQFKVVDVPELTHSLDIDTLDFGTVTFEDEVSKEVVITPGNELGLEIDDVRMFGGGNSGFELMEDDLPEFPHSLAFGEEMKITIKFSPTREGPLKTNLIISSNNYGASSYFIPVVAVGDDPNSVNETLAGDLSIEVLGNPVKEVANINISNDAIMPAQGKLILVNSLGEIISEVYSGNLNGSRTVTFDTASLPDGVYYLNLVADGASKTIPMVIAR
jgi:hypothetical protein